MSEYGRYTIATFEEEDVTFRLDDGDEVNKNILDYINEHDLMETVVMIAVEEMRDWFDYTAMDAMWDALDEGLKYAIGEDKLKELREEE